MSIAYKGLLAVALVITIGIAGCSDSDDGESQTSAPATETSVSTSSTPTPPAAIGTGGPTATPAATPSGQSVINPQALKQLPSYRYTLTMNADGVTESAAGALPLDIKGEHVAPYRTHVTATATLRGLSISEESITGGA